MKKTLAAIVLIASLAMPSMAMATDQDPNAPFWVQLGQALRNVALAPLEFAQGLSVDTRTTGVAKKAEEAAREAVKGLDVQPPSPAWPE